MGRDAGFSFIDILNESGRAAGGNVGWGRVSAHGSQLADTGLLRKSIWFILFNHKMRLFCLFPPEDGARISRVPGKHSKPLTRHVSPLPVLKLLSFPPGHPKSHDSVITTLQEVHIGRNPRLLLAIFPPLKFI